MSNHYSITVCNLLNLKTQNITSECMVPSHLVEHTDTIQYCTGKKWIDTRVVQKGEVCPVDSIIDSPFRCMPL